MTPEAADDILFIAIDYQGRRYMGAMLLDSSPRCVARFTFSCSRISVFRLRRSAPSIYRKIDRTGEWELY